MGYRRATTPRLDGLAATGVVFTKCISQAPWTTPSHLSILTGTHPGTHQGKQPIYIRQRRWRSELPTLASLLAAEGYLTAAFTGKGSISADFGFDKGFDTYNESGLVDGSDIEQVVDKVLVWLDRHAARSFLGRDATWRPWSLSSWQSYNA